MLWDSGNPDRLAALPNGLTNAAGTITAFMKKPLAESLKEIGVAPADIQHFAMSHSHGDHSGNANLFAASTLYMQERGVRRGVRARAAEVRLRRPPTSRSCAARRFVKLNGDHDVFGDGSVVIKSAPGHTPGHQVLFVRLPKRGAGGALGRHGAPQSTAGTTASCRRFNFDVPQSMHAPSTR